MSKYTSQVAIDNLTELALYSEHCWTANVIDDELYDLLVEGSRGHLVDALVNHTTRRMYFLFMAEMLKAPWAYVAPKPKEAFDGVSWLFDNHWITYEDILRVREAERLHNEEN